MVACLPLTAAATPATSATVHMQRQFALGDDKVTLDVQTRGSNGLTFVSVHENETTCVQAAQRLLQQHPGRLIALRQRGERLIDFTLAGKLYRFDPNRIFTEPGLALTLRRHGRDSPAARAAVRALRNALVDLLPSDDTRPIVAVHNNTTGAYSIVQYMPGGPLALDAEAVQLAQPAGHGDDDFFIVTDRALFTPLAAENFNVVLQSPAAADDGSMSIFAQRSGRRYVNVEALHGRLEAQQRMLASVVRLFGSHR